MRLFRRASFWLTPLVAGLLLVATGCSALGNSPINILDRGPDYPLTPSITESVAFTTTAARLDAIDAATIVLVTNNFSITLANERLGLLQTDYLSLRTLQQTQVDTVGYAPVLEQMLMKITINIDDRGEARYVQVKGTFQRVGDATQADNLIGLYWLERIAQDIADAIDARYLPQVTDHVYGLALEGQLRSNGSGNGENGTDADGRPSAGEQVKRGITALGIVALSLFLISLLLGSSSS